MEDKKVVEEQEFNFLLWWKKIWCSHIWKNEKSEPLGFSEVSTTFPVADHPGKKFVIVKDAVAEQQMCVKCGKRQVVEKFYQKSSGLVGVND